MDALVTAVVYVGGVAFVVALAAGLVLGRTWPRSVAIAVAGPLLAAAYVAVVVATSDPSDPCHDCGAYLGGWVEPVLFFLAASNAIAWIAGAFVGCAPHLFDRNERR